MSRAQSTLEAQFLRVFALDPSTDVTGAVVVSFGSDGSALAEAWIAIDAKMAFGKKADLTARLRRIRWTKNLLASFVARSPVSLDSVAYETDTERGHASTEALKMAAGAYLCLSALDGLPVVPITRQEACKAAGCLSVYAQAAGRTAAEKAAKKARLKASVVEWAARTFPGAGLVAGDPRSEAIADALAVACAAGKRHDRTERAGAEAAKAAQKAQARLVLRRTPKQKATVAE